MKKMTLLEMTQNILSALDSDEVNSISDTVESLQVAEIIKETFYEQFNNIMIPEFRGMVQLDDVNDLDKPNTLRVPDNVAKIEWIKYKDFRAGNQYRDLTYMDPEIFLSHGLMYTAAYGSITETTDASGITYFVRNDGPPSYFTILDDEHILFDSYDSDYEDTIQSSNTIAYVWKTFEFPLDDDFIPPMDGNLFPLLLAESKSVSFLNLKQISSTKDEQRARRQRIRMQNDQFKSRKAQYGYWNSRANYARHR